eukprot:5503358-Pyramimonas_sp.AAC.1
MMWSWVSSSSSSPRLADACWRSRPPMAIECCEQFNGCAALGVLVFLGSFCPGREICREGRPCPPADGANSVTPDGGAHQARL